MERLPNVIASTVVRSAHQGESHGGVYLIDLETGSVEQTIDYNEPSISWEGRGGPRGLRGIAFYEDEIYLAASDEIFVYSKDFRLVRSIENEYLDHCHETYLAGDRLFITSTGRDSVLEYDLRARRFLKGYHIRFAGLTRYLNMLGFWLNRVVNRETIEFGPMPRLRVFDPNSEEGPAASNTCHINNVFYDNGVVFVSGTRCRHLLAINDQMLSSHSRLPFRTHNACPFRDERYTPRLHQLPRRRWEGDLFPHQALRRAGAPQLAPAPGQRASGFRAWPGHPGRGPDRRRVVTRYRLGL